MESLLPVFKELYHEWFANTHFWFDKNEKYDMYLADKYFAKIEGIFGYHDELILQDADVQIGAIIAFDQIPRHHNRIKQVDCLVYSKIAADIALGFMSTLSINVYEYGCIPAYEWCFILLPFRHINDIERLNTIVRFVIEKHNNLDTLPQEKPIFKKYLLKTLNHVYKVNSQKIILQQKDAHKICQNTINQWTKYTEVLHNAPSVPIKMQCDELQPIFTKMQYTTRHITSENIILSLSGGVDSCVCLYLLKQMLPNNNIVAVHINYNNSPQENLQELKFVRKYCGLINVKLFHRTIHEIQRDDCHMHGLRDLYENITKDIRFDVYRQVSECFGNSEKTLVVLGHNMDDCFENILTNISNKSNYENLSGISHFSVVSDINLWRPMLDIRKHDILKFAIHNYIPFLKNSTPPWSTRGKIREVVYPALENINPEIMNAFFILKDYMQTYHELIDNFVLQDMINAFAIFEESKHQSYKGVFDKEKLICIFSIWKQIFESTKFKTLFRNKKISNKSITEFSKCLQRFKDNPRAKIKYILRHDIHVVLENQASKNITMTFFLV
jgi:tRNA(Ile)-lysidine synthetase-like protein